MTYLTKIGMRGDAGIIPYELKLCCVQGTDSRQSKTVTVLPRPAPNHSLRVSPL